MSIVSKLYFSQGRSTEVRSLVERIEEHLSAEGLVLWRWETNDTMRGYRKTISYAVGDKGIERPWSSIAAARDGYTVYRFRGAEGTTSRCRAYRVLRQIARVYGIEV